ncbi:MAG: hypothetical protein R3C19_10485 [Planctomycetaceae bacterium]
MASGNSDSRFLRSIVVAVLLAGTYAGYSALLSPVLDVARKERRLSRPAAKESLPSGARELAVRWFPADPWVAECGNDLHDGRRFLYYEHSETIDDGYTLKANPVALLWLDNQSDRDSVPVTVVAEQARLRTSEKLSVQSSGIGRIVGGVLDGSVRIRGPRNLRIDGDTFSVSENSLTLSSSHPVSFGWEDHTGEASKGVDIALRASRDEDGGLMSVSDVSEVRLNGRVTCQILIRARRADEEDIRLEVTAADGFKYHVDSRIGTFHGLHKRSQSSAFRLQDQVLVTRFAKDGTKDQLVCSQLELDFRPEVSPVTGVEISNRLRLERVVAAGEQVVFYSQAQNLTAKMSELTYLVDERRVLMRNTNRDPGDRPLPVEVSQQGSRLLVSELQILHASDGHVQRLECRGPGGIRHAESVQSGVLAAHWRNALVVQESADQLLRTVTLTGDAGVEQEQDGFELSADEIIMKLRNSPADAAVISKQPASGSAALDLHSLQPEQLTARGRVSLISPDATGTIRDQLTVTFEPAVLSSPEDGSAAGTSPGNPLAHRSRQPESSLGGDSNEAAVSFSADMLKATIRHGSDGSADEGGRRRMELANVWLTGQVELVRSDTDPGKTFTASGNSLEAANGLHDTRQIRLFGDPASIVTGLRRLDGKRIDVEQNPDTLTVDGSGRLRIVTDRGIDGTVLPRPTPLDIYWSESMSFQGRVAKFVGNIRVVVEDGATQDLELTCAGLKVHFNRDIGLQSDRNGNTIQLTSLSSSPGSDSSPPIEISRIECESVVTVRFDQLVDGAVHARHSARVVDLSVDTETGDCHALGPGWISSTSPDTEGPLQTTTAASARANVPARISDNEFVFVQASFIGELSGNLQQQNATLSQHVRGVFAPVRDINGQITVDTIPTDQLPENVGILRAERLVAAAIPAVSDHPASFSLTASENARIESRPFSGNADVITYDHSKQQFILRAEGSASANVRYRDGKSGGYSNTSGQRFVYNRATEHLAFNSISGLSGGK